MEAEVGIRSWSVTGVQTCPLPISVPIRPRIPTPTQRVSSHLGRDGCSAALCSCGVNAGLLPILLLVEIGRASCRERGESYGGGGRLKHNAAEVEMSETCRTKKRCR